MDAGGGCCRFLFFFFFRAFLASLFLGVQRGLFFILVYDKFSRFLLGKSQFHPSFSSSKGFCSKGYLGSSGSAGGFSFGTSLVRGGWV